MSTFKLSSFSWFLLKIAKNILINYPDIISERLLICIVCTNRTWREENHKYTLVDKTARHPRCQEPPCLSGEPNSNLRSITQDKPAPPPSHTRPALGSVLLLCLSHWLHLSSPISIMIISTVVYERNFNNVPTIKSLPLRRSKCTNSKKVYPLSRESLKQNTILLSLWSMLSHKRKCQACF